MHVLRGDCHYVKGLEQARHSVAEAFTGSCDLDCVVSVARSALRPSHCLLAVETSCACSNVNPCAGLNHNLFHFYLIDSPDITYGTKHSTIAFEFFNVNIALESLDVTVNKLIFRNPSNRGTNRKRFFLEHTTPLS